MGEGETLNLQVTESDRNRFHAIRLATHTPVRRLQSVIQQTICHQNS